MKKILYIVLIICALGIALSVCYYFIIFLPQQKNDEAEKEFLFSMRSKCRDMGQKLYEEDIKELGKNNVFVPEFYYNKRLNTCLYASGYVQENYLEKSVIDSLANKAVILFIEITLDGEKRTMRQEICPECLPSNNEFERQKQELFNQ